MKNDYSKIIDNITFASKHNNLTFFVGAGVSRCSGLKGWKQLIQELDLKLNGKKRKYYSTDDYLSIAEAFFHNSEDEYNQFLKDNFSDNILKPNEIHDIFFDFSPVNFITTNFDDLIEKAAIKNFKTYISVSKEDEITSVHGEHYIIKAHGDYKSKNIVFKDSDYMNYSTDHKLVDTLIKSVFASNLVIFVGYSLQDFTIRYILNWVHNCLKEKFKPIFIYTDDAKLLKSDIEYQESRGLRIVDWHDFFPANIQKKTKFIQRYITILKFLISKQDNNFSKTNHKFNFNLLYKKLEPLDSFYALRHEDIIKTLKYYVDIPSYGEIITIPSQPDILKIFLDYCKKRNNNKKIPNEDLSKYTTILSVFKKAGIFYTVRDGQKITFEKDFVADRNLILFDYKKILQYVNKNYKDDFKNYKKAYYLFTLGRFDEAYKLYQQIAFETFNSKKYLLYYLSQKNIFNLHEMKNSNSYLYNFTEISRIPKNEDDIFDELPRDFKIKYNLFQNMYSLSHLYQNKYNAQNIADKIENTNTSNTIEIGLTSFWKGTYFILNSLHFVLGNFLLTDEFNEFKTSIKVIMEQQLFKSTEMGKQSFAENPFHDFDENENIYFDQIDFYCFIKYFTKNEIQQIFSKYDIKKLLIRNENFINQAAKNLFNYYIEAVISSGNSNLIHYFSKKLSVCLEILTHIVLYPTTVEYISNIILNNSFLDIPNQLRWSFLNFQNENSCVNFKTQTIIVKYLIKKIEERIEILKTKKIEYPPNDCDFSALAEFIKNKNLIDLKTFNELIQKILRECQNYPIKELILYFNIVNKQNKLDIRNLATQKIQSSNFNIGIIINLIHMGEKLKKSEITIIHEYLENKILKTKKEFIDKKSENNLIEIGFLCFKGDLNKEDYKIYLGYTPFFDFLISPEFFPFEQFDIKWIYNQSLIVHDYFSKNENTRKVINKAITKTLQENNCKYADKKYLTDLYFKYYTYGVYK